MSDVATRDDVKKKVGELLTEMMGHDGFGELKVEMRILKRTQKEIIIHHGNQHRFVINYHARKSAGDISVDVHKKAAQK